MGDSSRPSLNRLLPALNISIILTAADEGASVCGAGCNDVIGDPRVEGGPRLLCPGDVATCRERYREHGATLGLSLVTGHLATHAGLTLVLLYTSFEKTRF